MSQTHFNCLCLIKVLVILLVCLKVTYCLNAYERKYHRLRHNNNNNRRVLKQQRYLNPHSIDRLKPAMSSTVERVKNPQENTEEMSREALVNLLQNKKHYQDIFIEQLEPQKIQFGHVCENPFEWEQRIEQNDYKTNRHQGKIRWGNKDDEYGEHYWDLGHANPNGSE